MEIREPKKKKELEQCFDLRYRILRKPWNALLQKQQAGHDTVCHEPQPRGSERDGLEDVSYHIAAFDNGRVVGVARLQRMTSKTARIRYMAVDGGFRNRGIGAMMLQRLEEEARTWGLKRVTLNAREGAVEFYRKHGYAVVKEVEKMFGIIPHFRMEKKL